MSLSLDVYVSVKQNQRMPTYSISELSKEFSVTPRAIRFYEDHGLLAPRRVGPTGMQRVYSQRDRTRLKLTLRGKRLGLTLSEISDLVNMYESPGDSDAQLEKFLVVLARHRQQLIQQTEDIRSMLAEIEAYEGQTRSLLKAIAEPPAVTSLYVNVK
jgi:DNA-binding transcriptional MerR regulator